MKIILACAVFLSSVSIAQAQQKFVQFIITDIVNESQCRDVEQYVMSNPGFTSVRAESNSGNFLAFFSASYSYTEANFSTWVTSLGYSFHCFRQGISGTDQVVRLSRSECDILEEKKRD